MIRRIPVFVPFFVIFAALGLLWSLATPIFASPDETAHATKAVAQLRGEFEGYERDGIRFPVIDLPESYRYSDGIVCYAFQPNVTADCNVELGTPDGTPWFGNWVLSYNPLYYYVVGWPTLFLDGNIGVYAMRFLSVVLNSAILALACSAALSMVRQRWMPIALGFFGSPMIMFLSGSVNPQGTEIVAGALTWISLISLFSWYRDARRSAHWRLWLPVIVGTLFLTQARAVGPLWWVITAALSVVVVGVSAVPALFQDRRAWPWMSLIAALAVASLAWTLHSGTFGGQADNDDAALVGGTALDGFWAMLRNTPFSVEQAIGTFGWLDTPIPGLVLSFYLAAVFLVLVLAYIGTDRRGRMLVLVTLATAILVPPIVQAAAVSRTGLIWQGRYSLFLYVGLIIIAAWLLGSRGDRRIDFLSVRATAVVAAVLSVYHVAVFVLVLRRYVVGNDTPITEMIYHPAWQPPLGWPTLVMLLIATLGGFTWLLVVAANRAPKPSALTSDAVDA